MDDENCDGMSVDLRGEFQTIDNNPLHNSCPTIKQHPTNQTVSQNVAFRNFKRIWIFEFYTTPTPHQALLVGNVERHYPW